MAKEQKNQLDGIQQGIQGFLQGGKFTNQNAIGFVVNAIKQVCNPNVSDDRKINSALFAAEAAINSETAGEEIQKVIQGIQTTIQRGE